MAIAVIGGTLPKRGNTALIGAFVAAMLVEAALFAGFIVWLGARPVPAVAGKPTMEISLVTLPPPPQPAPVVPVPPPPEVPPPQPATPPEPAPAPKPMPKPLPKRPAPVPPIVRPAEPPSPAMPATVQFPPLPEPQPAPSTAVSPDAMASFDSQIRAAIETAVEFPYAAQMMHQYGQARVAFDYRDGKISDLRLVQSSGFALLDPAALAAVRNAHYPPTPAELQHRLLHYVLWVRFKAGTN